VSWCIHDSVELEKAGVPVVALVSQEFLGLALADAAGLAVPGLPMIAVPLPRGGVGSIPPEAARAKADEVFEDVLRFATVPPRELAAAREGYLERFPEARSARQAVGLGSPQPSHPELEDVEDSLEGWLAVSRRWAERSWTDGHPIVPPIEKRVRACVAATGREAAEVLAVLPPKNGMATVGKVAANAVMAGCGPEHMPVLLATVEALAEKAFLLEGVQKTTHNFSPFVLVNGPVRHELQISSGEPGTSWQANAAIGRAIRFIAMNVADLPGRANVVTHGWLGKYMYCVAENEEKNPWEPLHVERGFRVTDSTVTVFPAEPPHNIDDQASLTPQGVLTTIAGTMASPGSEDFFNRGEPLLLLGPEHALRIARGDFSKADVRAFLFEHARVPLYNVSLDYLRIFSNQMQKVYSGAPNHVRLPMAARPEDFVLAVVGGLGQHSMWIANMGGAKSITKLIRR